MHTGTSACVVCCETEALLFSSKSPTKYVYVIYFHCIASHHRRQFLACPWTIFCNPDNGRSGAMSASTGTGGEEKKDKEEIIMKQPLVL